MLKMLTFCYPGLNKVTLVNQLSLLLICKTAIGETWNAAILIQRGITVVGCGLQNIMH